MPIQNSYNPNPELTQVHQNNVVTEQAKMVGGPDKVAPVDPRADSGFRLAEALGIALPVVQQFNSDYEKKKEEDQKAKLSFYVEQFKKDREDGAVSQAQVRKRFPETVPTIAAHIAEVVGHDDAAQKYGAAMEEVLGNDDLRLDTGKRTAFLKQKRDELMQNIPQGNEFYASGFVKGMDKQEATFNQQFTQETASYHQKVQLKAFEDDVATALMNGGDLANIDEARKARSSVSNLEANQAIVKTATRLAFAMDDPKMMDRIPVKYLNAESQAEVARTKEQITQQRYSNIRMGIQMKADAREEKLRGDKVDILTSLMGGQQPDPTKYKDSPEAFDYLMRMQNTPKMDEATSTGNAMRRRDSILNGQSIDGSKSLAQLTDEVSRDSSLNPSDKVAIIKDLPKLMEGRRVMEAPAVKEAFDLRIGAQLRALSSSPNAKIQLIVANHNLNAEVTSAYQSDIRNRVNAYYTDPATKGEWPTGTAMQKIVDESTDRAEKHIEKLMKIGEAGHSDTKSTPTPSAPSSGQKTITLPNGKKVIVG